MDTGYGRKSVESREQRKREFAYGTSVIHENEFSDQNGTSVSLSQRSALKALRCQYIGVFGVFLQYLLRVGAGSLDL
jgi:hypothetical protein